MPVIDTQTVDGSGQFDGTAGNGLWVFTQHNKLERTQAIALNLASYTELNLGGAQNVNVAVAFYLFRPGETDLSKRILIVLDNAKQGDLLNPITNNAEGSTTLGIQLPREKGDSGQFWSVICLTIDKVEIASASLTWAIVAVPESL